MGEPDSRIIDDLIYYFVEKKRLSRKNYNYIPTTQWDKYFREAAVLCEKHEMTPALYVQKLYDRLGGKKEFFSPEHLRGGNVDRVLAQEKESEETTYKIEVTNSNLDLAEVWRQQNDLAMRYIRRGESAHSVLMDSSLKFFAWYRILSTPEKDTEVIKKYRHIAVKELNSNLRDFILREGLDLDRILNPI